MILRTFQNKETTDLSYDMKIIHCYCTFQIHRFRKIIILITFSFIADILCGQEVWTTEDSIKLSKILNGETPVYIDDDLKKELENSFIGNQIKENSSSSWNDFILDIKPDDYFVRKYHTINLNDIFYKSTSSKFFNLNNEYLKLKKFTIDSHIDVDVPFIYIQRNTNLVFPLNRNLHFNISGSYTIDKSHSPILPITPTPYSMGAGFSYNIGKNITIGPQANYQFNIIQKRWEWFWGLKMSITF